MFSLHSMYFGQLLANNLSDSYTVNIIYSKNLLQFVSKLDLAIDDELSNKSFLTIRQLMKDVNYFTHSMVYKVHLRHGSNICKIPVNYWDCGKRS